jgi:hypothetical protein
MNKRNVLYITLAALVIGALAIYLNADTISLTLPPWDFCGWHETKAGTAFDCIAYDVNVWALK